MGEFDLIKRYFTRQTRHAVLGVGDDCALLQPAAGCQLAISSDMLVEGRHFFPDVDPCALGHKALAVNLSDLAACGARPLAFTLALALPRADAAWLEPFSRGLLALADAHDCELVGGDTTQGPLNICITVFGEVPLHKGRSLALLRSGAQDGDDIYVSGDLGGARLALDCLLGKLTLAPALLKQARQRLETPTPRIALGMALRAIASAAIDISDGLLGDLDHILEASKVGAVVDTALASNLMALDDRLPVALTADMRLAWILSGGDDYELAFTAPVATRAAVQAAGITSATRVTRIGRIESTPGLRLLDFHGAPLVNRYHSFDHFS